MSHRAIKPLRVTLAVVGGLALGLLLVRVMTPHPTGLEAETRTDPEPAHVSAAPAVAHDGRIRGSALRVTQQTLATKLPAYPAAGAWVHIGDALDTDRVPMALVSFETKDTDAKVLEYYAEHFERAGLPWQGVQQNFDATGGVPAVSATDEAGDLQLSVMAFAHEGGTTVILSAADMKTFYERVNADLVDDGDLPTYPGSTPAVMRATESTRDSMMVSFATTDPPDQVASFYRSTLSASGFHEVASDMPTPTAALHHLDFTSRTKSWRFFLSQTRTGTAVAVQGVSEAAE